MTITNYSLKKLLGNSLTSHPCVSIKNTDKVWTGSILLIHYLESFTDSLVVTKNDSPIGIVGGQDVLSALTENPTSELFFEKNMGDIMYPEVSKISSQTKLSDLISQWKESRRAFSIIPNLLGNYSSISARSMMEIGIKIKTDLKISNLPKKEPITCTKNDTIKRVIDLMFANKTRKILLENSTKFISGRIILEKISRDLEHLKKCKNFFELQISDFMLPEAKKIEDDISLPEAYKIMMSSIHPYIIYKKQPVTPWDLCLALLSDEISLNK